MGEWRVDQPAAYRTLIVLLLAAPFVFGGAAAAEDGGAGRLEGARVRFDGAGWMDLVEPVVWLRGDGGEGAPLRLIADEATVYVERVSTLHTVDALLEYQAESRTESHWYSPAEFLLQAAPGGTLVVRGPEARSEASGVRALDASPRRERFALSAGGGEHSDFRVEVPAGSLRQSVLPLRFPVGEAFLLDGNLRGSHVADASTEDGETLPGRTEAFYWRNVTFIRIVFTNGVVSPDAGVPLPRLFAESVLIDLKGSVHLPRASGWVREGERHAVVEEDVILDGRILAEGSSSRSARLLPRGIALDTSPGAPKWIVEGEFRVLHAGGPRFDDGLAVAATSVAVAAGALYSLRGIFGVLAAAVAESVASLYTRIRKADVLPHPARAGIIAAVGERPGIQLKELQDGLGMREGTLRYHLRRLAKLGFLRVETSGRFVLLYPSTAHVFPQDRLRVRPRAVQVHEGVRSVPGSSARELGRRLGMDHQLVYYHLEKLSRLGLVRAQGRQPARYYPADPARVGEDSTIH